MTGSETHRLSRPVDVAFDHCLGPSTAEITLVEYGSYACPFCRAANEEIARVRDRLGDRARYVFRHRPLTGSEIARRAAELAELAPDEESFWTAHVTLMTRSHELSEEDLVAVRGLLGLSFGTDADPGDLIERARARVDADEESARQSGVIMTPSFFINGRRYDGPWDEQSLADAMLGRLGHRVQSAAVEFASWGPSAGVLLLVATILAIALANTPLGPPFEHLLHRPLGFLAGDATFQMSLLHWINDGLLTIFFLVVGLEIKREVTVGRLASPRKAAFPIAGAIGGILAPALLYLLIAPPGPWSRGWGVPVATDTAFAIALIVMMGRRVPLDLRIFLTAAAIVDDLGAIVVVALFYSGELRFEYLAAAALVVAGLWAFGRFHVYRLAPYLALGVALWACIHASGLHATLAGVILALAIPTRPPANLRALTIQADTIIAAEAKQGEILRHGPSRTALRALDAIHDRIESPADRLLRRAGARSSYLILPIFALANAGVEISLDVVGSHMPLVLAIVAGLVLGKPLGMISACALAVALGIAVKPEGYSWRQLAGAGALAGIGFTMSLFIAGQAFPATEDFAAAKIAVFLASLAAACAGVLLLRLAGREGATTSPSSTPEAARRSPVTDEPHHAA